MKRSYIIIMFLLMVIGLIRTNAASVTLAWDSSPDQSVIGYNLCYGLQSGNYIITHVVTGNILSNVVDNLIIGTTYYFAVQAFDANGLYSDFSNEVIYTPSYYSPPPNPPKMKAKHINTKKVKVGRVIKL